MLVPPDEFRKARREKKMSSWMTTALDYTETRHMISFMKRLSAEPLPSVLLAEKIPAQPRVESVDVKADNQNTPDRDL